jgi:uncharacterized protein (TIGR02145 family)
LYCILNFLNLFNRCSNDNNPDDEPATVTDIDGNVYNTVKIANRLWTVENLKVSKLNDGTSITLASDNWFFDEEPSRCYYNNDGSSFKDTYGALYNMYAVYTKKLCPIDWHVPPSDEWKLLINYHLAGGELKESDTNHWYSPNTGANNNTGFTALPGGQRLMDGSFSELGYQAHFWIDNSPAGAINIEMFYNNTYAYEQGASKWSGLSVRCIKDK